MSEKLPIFNNPVVQELWAGIGGHFDSLGQIINEFIDNSISNFVGNNTAHKEIRVALIEKSQNESYEVEIEDTGTGIKDLDAAFTLGSQASKDSPLNEHGFGLKHALASANPENDDWDIFTRTEDDIANNKYKRISAPYALENYSGEVISLSEKSWPGKMNSTGTLIRFSCSKDMLKSITKGLSGNYSTIKGIADVLCEDLGFVYAGIIKNGHAIISVEYQPSKGGAVRHSVGAVEPDWESYITPKSGSQQVDLGEGFVKIEYEFGKVNEKPDRVEFDNETTKKYYKANMSSSGVEIRINGRVLCYNLFKEIWNIEKHNTYNSLLVKLNLVSQDRKALPTTRTSKNGLREGDVKLNNLYSWILKYMSDPPRNLADATHEVDLFKEYEKNLKLYAKPEEVTTEKYVFTRLGNLKDKQRIDMYSVINGETTVYEGKIDSTTSKDVYQLRMYWDGLVYDGVNPDIAKLIAKNHPDSVKTLISIVNDMKDQKGNNYNFELATWKDVGIDTEKK